MGTAIAATGAIIGAMAAFWIARFLERLALCTGDVCRHAAEATLLCCWLYSQLAGFLLKQNVEDFVIE
jgi:ABC-type lipoprotein release transport system permease subunit